MTGATIPPMPRKRPRGSGSVYLRGRIWWFSYWQDGQAHYESSGSEDREEANRQLKVKIGDIAAGRDIVPGKATVDDLFRLVVADYRLRKLRNLRDVEWRYGANVAPVLGRKLAARVRTSDIRAYATERLKTASPATVNRELAILHRAFTLGKQEEPPLIGRIPKIQRLEEGEARKGFLEPEQFDRLLEELPDRLRAMFVVGYHTGARRGELRKLRWEQVDFTAREIRLEGGQTKNKRARVLPIYNDMEKWLRWQRERIKPACPWVFANRGRPLGTHLDGWAEACERAGFPGLLFHDLRRSAVRNLIRSGVPEKTAMEITGHKTRSVFDRYNIITGEDVKRAAEKTGEYLDERRKAARPKLQVVNGGK